MDEWSIQRLIQETFKYRENSERLLLNIEYLNILDDYTHEQEIEAKNIDALYGNKGYKGKQHG